MRTTVDIPDELYRELKTQAIVEHTTVKDYVVQSVRQRLGSQRTRPRFRPPVLESSEPGAMRLSRDELDDLLYD